MKIFSMDHSREIDLKLKIWRSIFLYRLPFLLLILTGCDMYDPITKEMDKAFAVKESNDDVTLVVEKYFPKGLPTKDALKLLRVLHEQGFEIRENRLDGMLIWSKEDFKPYKDEMIKKNRLIIDPTGVMIDYTAKKKYDSNYLIVTKEAQIYVRTDNNGVLTSSGAIFIHGI